MMDVGLNFRGDKDDWGIIYSSLLQSIEGGVLSIRKHYTVPRPHVVKNRDGGEKWIWGYQSVIISTPPATQLLSQWNHVRNFQTVPQTENRFLTYQPHLFIPSHDKGCFILVLYLLWIMSHRSSVRSSSHRSLNYCTYVDYLTGHGYRPRHSHTKTLYNMSIVSS